MPTPTPIIEPPPPPLFQTKLLQKIADVVSRRLRNDSRPVSFPTCKGKKNICFVLAAPDENMPSETVDIPELTTGPAQLLVSPGV